jgi:hypothetical protein
MHSLPCCLFKAHRRIDGRLRRNSFRKELLD